MPTDNNIGIASNKISGLCRTNCPTGGGVVVVVVANVIRPNARLLSGRLIKMFSKLDKAWNFCPSCAYKM